MIVFDGEMLSPGERANIEGKFLELLKIRTISCEGPSGSYALCRDFLISLCREVLPEAEITCFTPVESDKPVVVVDLKANVATKDLAKANEVIWVNGHYDVVPCVEEDWKVPPFDGIELNEYGETRIYGRGTQDMKSLLIAYIFAIASVKSRSKDVIMTFVPDEEIGGADGMEYFLRNHYAEAFGSRSVLLAMDEGMVSEEPQSWLLFNSERMPVWVVINIEGETGHASLLLENTVSEKACRVMNKVFSFRDEQRRKLGCLHQELGDVTSVNITVMETSTTLAQKALNLIPANCVLGLDIRVPPEHPEFHIQAILDDWCSEQGVSWQFAPWTAGPTPDLVPKDRLVELKEKIHRSLTDLFPEISIVDRVFPAATDSRFLRAVGIPAFGFTPISGVTNLMHKTNEYIPTRALHECVEAYSSFLCTLLSEEF